MKHKHNLLSNPHTTEKTPVVISAKGKILGRLATEVAMILRGKDSVHFQKHLLSGRPVVVTHAKDIIITGNKINQKHYFRHSGYIGNWKLESLKERLQHRPAEVIRHAVHGMLPANRLRKFWLSNLEIRDEE